MAKERSGQHTFFAARQTHQPFGVLRNFVECGRSRAFFFLAEFVACDEVAKILITLAIFDEKRQSNRSWLCGIRQPRRMARPVSETHNGNLRTHMRVNTHRLCRNVNAWSTVHSVAIDQGYCGK